MNRRTIFDDGFIRALFVRGYDEDCYVPRVRPLNAHFMLDRIELSP